jgi:predicted transcriptional regulator
MTCAWIDTSSADTGSSQTISAGSHRQRAGDADALALAAGEFVRIAARVLGLQADLSPAARHARARSAAARPTLWMTSASPTMAPPSCAD